MYTERDSNGWISIQAMSQDDAAVVQIGLLSVIESLPQEQQRRFRRLAMEIDKLLKPK